MTAMWQVIAYTGFTVIAFYFFLLRPVLQDQRSRRKAMRQLQVGDEIVTTGGIIGEVKDEFGTTVGNIKDHVDRKLSDETAAQLARRPLEWDTNLVLFPGNYTIKVLVRDDETGRIVQPHLFTQREVLVFDVRPAGAGRIHLEEARLEMGRQVNIYGAQVAHDLGGSFIEADVQRTLASRARGNREEPAESRLRRPGRARDENVAPAVISALQHVIQTRQAG